MHKSYFLLCRTKVKLACWIFPKYIVGVKRKIWSSGVWHDDDTMINRFPAEYYLGVRHPMIWQTPVCHPNETWSALFVARSSLPRLCYDLTLVQLHEKPLEIFCTNIINTNISEIFCVTFFDTIGHKGCKTAIRLFDKAINTDGLDKLHCCLFLFYYKQK